MYCSIAVVVLLCLNIGLCFLRTDENHSFLLALNILTDTVCGGAVLYRAENSIRTKRNLLRLMDRTQRSVTAVVEEISTKTYHIPGLSCVLVHTGERVFYLPQAGAIQLEKGTEYTFQVVDNVIVEAAV